MYRNLFLLFTALSFVGLVACGANLWGAAKQWYFRRPGDGLGRITARHRFRQQGLPFVVSLGLSVVAVAVLTFSQLGERPTTPTGWILYGVLWTFLISAVLASVDQRVFDQRIMHEWDGIERRG